MKSQEVQSYFGSHRIVWKFITEQAPWWGGFWERLIRSVKSTLKKTLGNNFFNYEELSTTLYQVEAMINSRPITFVYAEASEPTPLTPSHFLIGQRLTMLPPDLSSTASKETPSSRELLQRRWKHREHVLNNLWKRWRREYLQELRSAHINETRHSESVKLGDIVLIKELNSPRQLWKMGQVTELFPGSDGKVRSCKVRTSSGNTLRRPIQMLYHLESSGQAPS